MLPNLALRQPRSVNTPMTSQTALVLAALLWLSACATPPSADEVLAASGPCQVHLIPLDVALLPVEHSDLNGDGVSGYAETRPRLFPNAAVPQLYGRAHEITLEVHCVQCTLAEFDWLVVAFDGVILDGGARLPAFYDVPQGLADREAAVEPEWCRTHDTQLRIGVSKPPLPARAGTPHHRSSSDEECAAAWKAYIRCLDSCQEAYPAPLFQESRVASTAIRSASSLRVEAHDTMKPTSRIEIAAFIGLPIGDEARLLDGSAVQRSARSAVRCNRLLASAPMTASLLETLGFAHVVYNPDHEDGDHNQAQKRMDQPKASSKSRYDKEQHEDMEIPVLDHPNPSSFALLFHDCSI
jgi:hypothetical protein